MRNLVYLLRNPSTLRLIFSNAIIMGLVTLSIFYKAGDFYHAKTAGQAFGNFVGMSFATSNNFLFPAVSAVVLQMPLQVPVFKREVMNRMYSPTVYYFARILSGILVQLFYPTALVLILFFGLGITISVENFFLFWITAI